MSLGRKKSRCFFNFTVTHKLFLDVTVGTSKFDKSNFAKIENTNLKSKFKSIISWEDLLIMKKTVLASTLAVGLGVTGIAAGNSADASEQGIDHAQLAQQEQAPQTQDQTQPQQASSEQPAQEQAPQTEQTQQPQQEAASSQQSTGSSSEASSGSSVDVNDHLKQIAQRESGGDLKAVNPSSGAARKYQILQSTWDSVAPDEYKGVSPTEAPESVQDQAAMDLY